MYIFLLCHIYPILLAFFYQQHHTTQPLFFIFKESLLSQIKGLKHEKKNWIKSFDFQTKGTKKDILKNYKAKLC